MIEKKLEILLITYNRAKELDNTLQKLLKSPFAKCKLTVLDNCSSDNTHDVCLKYQSHFPCMKIKRHPKNLGADSNYLHAVETSKSTYTWVLCDDDNYDFSETDDVINAINAEKFDILLVGSQFRPKLKGEICINSKSLVEDIGALYFHFLSFIPNFIFKTELFDSNCLMEGYHNVINLYPHFIFINKSFENNFYIYVSKNGIVIPGTTNMPSYSFLFWICCWINSCSIIKNKSLRRKVIYDISPGIHFIKILIGAIALEKIKDGDSGRLTISLISSFIIAFGFSLDLLFLLLIIILGITPKFIFNAFVRIYFFIKKKIYGEDIPELFRTETI